VNEINALQEQVRLLTERCDAFHKRMSALEEGDAFVPISAMPYGNAFGTPDGKPCESCGFCPCVCVRGAQDADPDGPTEYR
jgi:hypothetical protein